MNKILNFGETFFGSFSKYTRAVGKAACNYIFGKLDFVMMMARDG